MPPMTRGPVSPWRPISLSAVMRAATVTTTAPWPSQSMAPERLRSDGPTTARVNAMQATPTGRLMAKTQRQPSVFVSTPPISGPAVAATPAIAPQSPNARARACGVDIDLLQQRQRPRHEQRGADALDDAHHGQDGLVGCQHAAQRGEREDAHAEAEDAPVPPAVAQRPAEQEQPGEGHGVAVDDPLEVGQRDRQVTSDGGRGDVHDRDVEDHHEVAGADGDQRRQTNAPDLCVRGRLRRHGGHHSPDASVRQAAAPGTGLRSRP